MFYNIQRSLILPTVNTHFDKNIAEVRGETRGDDKVGLGDGRFDSPGKSAKYCTYSIQCPSSKKIIASTTIQTVNGKGSAPLELAAFQDCLKQLKDDGYPIEKIATDRNKQIAKWVRENIPNISHGYDPWHFAKNIKAKLRPLTLRKDRRILQDWIKPIGNHLFWCANNCDGDPEQLIQMWKSLLNHVTNKHKFSNQFPKYPKCQHREFTSEEARKKKWIEKDSPAYQALDDVITNPRDLKDMEHLADPYHTGEIEVFHSLITCYAPKRQEFELNVMDARVKLAILDHNNNVKRKQSTIINPRKGSAKVGEKKWKFVCSKLSKDWVAKPVKEPKCYDFMYKIIDDIIDQKEKGAKVKIPAKKALKRLHGPKNIAYTPRPDIKDILEKHFSAKRLKK